MDTSAVTTLDGLVSKLNSLPLGGVASGTVTVSGTGPSTTKSWQIARCSFTINTSFTPDIYTFVIQGYKYSIDKLWATTINNFKTDMHINQDSNSDGSSPTSEWEIDDSIQIMNRPSSLSFSVNGKNASVSIPVWRRSFSIQDDGTSVTPISFEETITWYAGKRA